MCIPPPPQAAEAAALAGAAGGVRYTRVARDEVSEQDVARVISKVSSVQGQLCWISVLHTHKYTGVGMSVTSSFQWASEVRRLWYFCVTCVLS